MPNLTLTHWLFIALNVLILLLMFGVWFLVGIAMGAARLLAEHLELLRTEVKGVSSAVGDLSFTVQIKRFNE